MLTQTLSPRQRLWKRVALSASLGTLIAIASLLCASFFRLHGTVVRAGEASASLLSENDPAIESLSKKIATENEEHQVLQAKREHLASSIQQMPSLVFAPAERARHQLVTQLVRLLELEKQYPEGSPEITDTRAQIDKLQSEIAEMPPGELHQQTTTSPARTLLETQLSDTDRHITQNEADTKADVSQLGRLVRAKELSASRRSSNSGSDVPAIVLVSLLLGLVAGSITLILARVHSIRDESVLRHVLPSTVQLIGQIPHMRART